MARPREFDPDMGWIGEKWRDLSDMKARMEREMALALRNSYDQIKHAVMVERARGNGFSKIANSTGISHTTLRTWEKEYLATHGSLPEVAVDELSDEADLPSPIPKYLTVKNNGVGDIIVTNDNHPNDGRIFISGYKMIGRHSGNGFTSFRPEWLTDDILRSIAHYEGLGVDFSGAPWLER